MKTIAIVGGGPSGLMAAHLLERSSQRAAVTVFEASGRLGGKCHTRRFDAAPVLYESGVAECYDYHAFGHDPLRELVRELGLRTVPAHSTAVALDGRILGSERDIRTCFGDGTLEAVEQFRRDATARLTLAGWQRGFAEEDNRHPWARLTSEEVLDSIADPIARKYMKIGAHSDMATEPHLVNGLIGLRNFLKSAPGYGAQYGIEGGMEQLPRRLVERLTSTRIALDTSVTSISKTRDGRYAVRFRRGTRRGQVDVDGVVLALPYNYLPTIEMGSERLRRAMAAHVAHYDSPGHYLRVSILFDAPFWRSAFEGAWVMLDAFGGCCVYDESARLDAGSHGVLGWLLAGADALRLCNADDRTLIARVLESLPHPLQREASARFIEGKVHRWAGAVSGQPGGFRLRAPQEAHQPEPVDHPGIVVVGDYLFDSTLNGVLRSARIATDLLAEATGGRADGAEVSWRETVGGAWTTGV
jgi:monoamine oxidase